MKRWIPVFVALALLLTITTASAQGPRPQHSDPAWQASYWNNRNLQGAPVVQRMEDNLNFDWDFGSPDGEIVGDGFSARWTRYIDITTPQMFRFAATCDDGMRIWVSGNLVLDEWRDHVATLHLVDVALPVGHHLVVVEYYENSGHAVAKLGITPNIINTGNWRGEYYNNPDLSGNPTMVRDDPALNFSWGNGSPAVGAVDADHFSVRWTRNVNLPAGQYRFNVTVDDGARLWVNGHLLLDDWRDQGWHTHTNDIYLPGGSIPLKLEYYEHTGGAFITLTWEQVWWEPIDAPVPPAPTATIIDNGREGFVRGGAASDWHTATGWGNDLFWSYNNDRTRSGYNWARWTPNLAPGTYEVLAHMMAQSDAATRARYTITHAGGRATVVINQNGSIPRWASLGTYTFNGGSAEAVVLTDVTGERLQTRRVVFDAMKFDPR